MNEIFYLNFKFIYITFDLLDFDKKWYWILKKIIIFQIENQL